MSDTNKKLKVNASSLVDLKAELIRKQEQFRQQRLQRKAGVPVTKHSEKKTNIWSKKNTGVLLRSQRDLEAKAEEENNIKKARSSLEAKAKIYEQMTSAKDLPDEDGSGRYLVDFQQKVMDNVMQHRQEMRRKEEDERKRREEEEERKDVEKCLKESIPETRNPEEIWVDYVDSLGRSRHCLKKDLPELISQDKEYTAHRGSTSSNDEKSKHDLMSIDMYREMLRQKWEQEEQEMLEKPAGPIHYTDVQWNEIRDHGVAYYKFAKDEESRQEQMDALHKLREQTKEQRARKDRVKEKRKAIMAARLAKVRQRRGIQASPEDDENQDETSAKKEEEVEELKRDDSWRKDAPMREWDEGKTMPRKWVEQRREEREEEFAPPAFYSASKGEVKGKASEWRNKMNMFKSQKESVSCVEKIEQVENEVDARLKVLRKMTEVKSTEKDPKSASEPIPLEKGSHESNETTDEFTCKHNVTDSTASYSDYQYQDVASSYNQWNSVYSPMYNPDASYLPYMGYMFPPPGPYPPPLVSFYHPSPCPQPNQSFTDAKTMPGTSAMPPPPGTNDMPPPTSTSAMSPPPGTNVMPPPTSTSAMPPPCTDAMPPHTTTSAMPPPPGTNVMPPPTSTSAMPPPTSTSAIQSSLSLPPGTFNMPPPPGTNVMPPPPGTDAMPHLPGTNGMPPPGMNAMPPPPGMNAMPPPTSTNPMQSSLSLPLGTSTYSPSQPLLSYQQNSSAQCVQSATFYSEKDSLINGQSTQVESRGAIMTSGTARVSSNSRMSTTHETSGPQPAHYSSGPTKTVHPVTVRKERAYVHQLPSALPAPPSVGNVPQYRSTVSVHGGPSTSTKPQQPARQIDVQNWFKQYNYKDTSNNSSEKVLNIPFRSPYIQKKDDMPEQFPKVDFDPSKPPPNIETKR